MRHSGPWLRARKVPGCGHDFLVAFSCKGRGVCPSCNAHRTADDCIPALVLVPPALVPNLRRRYASDRIDVQDVLMPREAGCRERPSPSPHRSSPSSCISAYPPPPPVAPARDPPLDGINQTPTFDLTDPAPVPDESRARIVPTILLHSRHPWRSDARAEYEFDQTVSW